MAFTGGVPSDRVPVAGDLSGRVALVTGAGRGIGRETALALADAGADVVVLARTRADLEAVATEVRSRGRRAAIAQADVADEAAVSRAMREVELGPIDVLVNNAGNHGKFGPVWELESEPFALTLLTSVLGTLHLVRAVVPGMIERRQGVVIDVSSGVARMVPLARAAYSTAKAALDQLSRVLAAEAAPHGVRVHTVYPGFTDTESQAELRIAPGLPDAVRAEFVARLANGLLQSPEVPAAAIAWLASPAGEAWPDHLLNWGNPDERERVLKVAGAVRLI